MADVDDSTCCPVCLETYKEDGDSVPRILPCFHTLCEQCIGTLLKGKTLECPECRRKHHVQNKAKSFQQNKYVLSQLKANADLEKKYESILSKTIRRASVGKEFETCQKHNREIGLFCKEILCMKPICAVCMIEEHEGHTFEDLKVVNQESYSKLQSDTEILISKRVQNGVHHDYKRGAEQENRNLHGRNHPEERRASQEI